MSLAEVSNESKRISVKAASVTGLSCA